MRRDDERRGDRALVHPFDGPSMMPNSSDAETDERQHRADGIESACGRVLRLRHEEVTGDQRGDPDRDVHPEHRAPREVLEQHATDDRSEGHAETGEARPDGDRPTALPGSRKTFVRIESVDGMISAPPMPISDRAG